MPGSEVRGTFESGILRDSAEHPERRLLPEGWSVLPDRISDRIVVGPLQIFFHRLSVREKGEKDDGGPEQNRNAHVPQCGRALSCQKVRGAGKSRSLYSVRVFLQRGKDSDFCRGTTGAA